MKRAAVPTAMALAALVVAAVAVWTGLVRNLADTMTAQARLAGELFDANVPVGEALARTLLRPGIHILITDRRANVFIDGGSAGVHVLPPPPGPGPPGPPRHGPVATLALSLGGLPPIRVERGERAIEIAPDARVLASRLTIESVLFVVCSLAVVAFATVRTGAFAREQRRALEARAAERDAAAERFRRFLAEAGHELRTPLTVIAGYVEILQTRDAKQPLDERVIAGMQAETSRMRVLVEKMMTLARLESDVAVPCLLDVATAAREAAQTLQRRYPARDVHVRIENTASIVIDAGDYAAAVGNLLENAVKHAPQSAVAIETTVAGGSASTAVIDDGPGISERDRGAIFEQFYRGRAGGEGLGLGLAIVKRVADRWNGSIECRSDEGRTVFRLTFPVADEVDHGVAG